MFIACDYVKVSDPQQIRHVSKNLDPEIESLELSTVLPLDFISMRVFRKDHRQILKIELCTKQILLFEFGGFLLRSVRPYSLSCYKCKKLLSLDFNFYRLTGIFGKT